MDHSGEALMCLCGGPSAGGVGFLPGLGDERRWHHLCSPWLDVWGVMLFPRVCVSGRPLI